MSWFFVCVCVCVCVLHVSAIGLFVILLGINTSVCEWRKLVSFCDYQIRAQQITRRCVT
jgi:hypothetical protein